MPVLSVEEVIARYELAYNAKANWKSNYIETFRYTMPERSHFDERTEGTRYDRELFSSLPITTTEELANSLLTSLTPHDYPWVKLDVKGNKGKENLTAEQLESLAEIEDIVRDSIEESNFATEAVQCYMDLAAGTCVMKVEPSREPDQVLRFESVPLGEFYLEKGYRGMASTIFRLHRMTLREAVQLYGDDFQLDRHIDRYETEVDRQRALSEPCEILEGCIALPPAAKTGADSPRNYFCCYIDKKFNYYISEHEEDVSPYVIARWSVASKEVYGRGPAWMALPDIKANNKFLEYVYRRSFQAIAPPWMARYDGVMNPATVNPEPNAIIPVDSTDGPLGAPLVPIEIAGDFQLGLITIRDVEERIKTILMSEDLAPLEGGTKSPEEVAVRHQNYLRKVGAVYPRLLREWMVPLVKRVLYLLKDAGNLAEGNRENTAVDIKDAVFKPEMALGERRQVAEALQRFIGTMNEVIPGGAATTLNLPKLPAKTAFVLGLPAEYVVSEDEMEARIQGAQQAAEQAAQQQQPQEAAAGV